MTAAEGWVITWGDRAWSDEQVIGADLAAVQLIAGGGWDSLDPWAGPVQLMAWITALEVRTAGRSVDDVRAELSASPAEEVVGALRPRIAATAG